MLFAICALLPLVGFAMLAVGHVSSQLNADVRTSLHNAAKTAGMGISARLSQASGDLALAAELINSSRVEGAWSDRGVFERRVSDHIDGVWLCEGGRVEAIFGTCPAPEMRYTEAEREHLGKGRALAQLVGSGHDLLMTVALDPASGTDARVALQVRRDWLFDASVLCGPRCELAVCDARGNVVFDTFPSPDDADLLSIALHSPDSSGTIEWKVGGDEHVARYWRAFLAPQYGADLTIVQSRSVADAYAVRDTFLYWFVLMALGTLLVVVLISLVQIRRTLDPILQLREATAELGAGRLDVRVSIDTEDEFSLLGLAFNEMATSLQESIRRRELTEQKLVDSRDEALAAARAKAEFVTNVSHEFRTPMTEILSAVEILDQLGDKDREARREFVDIALHGAQSLSRLIDDVLELGRGASAERSSVDVEASVREVVEALPEAERARVHCAFGGDLPPIRGEHARVVDVWSRLLDNAIKFSDADSAIEVRTAAKAGDVVVEIRDHGCGIALEDLQTIFQPFVQVGRDQMIDKAGGTGLGLALVQDTVQQHGGRVHVASKVGVGTTFRVRLPVQARAHAGRDTTTTFVAVD